MVKRVQFFSLWARNIVAFVEGTCENINPQSLWFSGFFFPQGLLAAISQNYARKYRVSIDSLQFKFEMQNAFYDESEVDVGELFDEETRFALKNNDGVLLCGLFMDGAKWSREYNSILDSKQRFTPVPHILCKMIEVSPKKFLWSIFFKGPYRISIEIWLPDISFFPQTLNFFYFLDFLTIIYQKIRVFYLIIFYSFVHII